jgi:hypothetical protein
VGIFDALFGRTKPVQSKSEALFAMATASVTLATKLNLQPSGNAGVVFRPVESSYFRQAEQDLTDLLQISKKDDQIDVQSQTDEYGYRWILLNDSRFEDLVANIHMVSLTLTDKGFGDQLLAAVFRTNQRDAGNRAVYWIYNYKRGKFYPFVPQGGSQQRDMAAEMQFATIMDGELPMEKSPEYLYPLWGIPF